MKIDSILSWSATVILLIATAVRAFEYSHFGDLILTGVGLSLWFCYGIRAKNAPLIITNFGGILLILYGIFFNAG